MGRANETQGSACPDLGARWPSRLVATAAEDQVAILPDARCRSAPAARCRSRNMTKFTSMLLAGLILTAGQGVAQIPRQQDLTPTPYSYCFDSDWRWEQKTAHPEPYDQIIARVGKEKMYEGIAAAMRTIASCGGEQKCPQSLVTPSAKCNDGSRQRFTDQGDGYRCIA
jgi:hypothetical protein